MLLLDFLKFCVLLLEFWRERERERDREREREGEKERDRERKMESHFCM